MTTNPLAPTTNQPGTAAALHAISRFSPVDPMKLLRQYAKPLIAAGVLGVILGVGVWGLLRYFSPQYTSEAQLIASGAIMDPFQPMQEAGSVNSDQIGTYIQNQMIRVKSDEILDYVLKNEEIRKTEWFKSFVQEGPGADPRELDAERTVLAKEELQKNTLSINTMKGTTLINVSLKGERPSDLPGILEIIINVYLTRLRNDTESQSSDLRMTFSGEKERAEDDLKQVHEKIKKFTIDNNLPDLQSQGHEATISYRLLSDQEAKLVIALQSTTDAYQGALRAQREGKLAPSPEELAQVEFNPAISSRDERLRNLSEEREVAAHRFGAKHQYVRDIEQRIQAVEAERKKEFDKLLLEQEQLRINASRNAVDSYQTQLAGLRLKLEDARNRMRDLNLKLQQYEEMADQVRAANERRSKVEESLNNARIRISRPDYIRIRRQQGATLARLTFPMPHIIIPMVAFVVLGGVAGAIYLKEVLDQRIKTPADVKLLPRLDLVGVIPDAADDPAGPSTIENAVIKNPSGLLAEAFRQVRTTLIPKMDRRGYKTIMFVSAQPLSGTSAVVGNLALSLAASGRRVLVLDANLRQPSQHQIFNTPLAPGLTDVLQAKATAQTAIVHHQGIDILPTGDASAVPPELLEGASFRNLLGKLEREYEFILIDAPPALLTSDCLMLAKHVDSLVIVIRAMGEQRGMIGRMLRQFEGLRADILGAILNRAQSSAGGYFRKSYQDFYSYGQNKQTNGKALAPDQIAVRN